MSDPTPEPRVPGVDLVTWIAGPRRIPVEMGQAASGEPRP